MALGFFKEIVGVDVGFFELTYYMAPIGWAMTFLLWAFFMIVCKPEKERIPGLREKARELNAKMGSLTRDEILAAVIVGAVICIMSLRAFVPALKAVDKTAIILCSSVLFFIFKILDLKDLEDIPWNIILLFAGAMSIGFCLWETGRGQVDGRQLAGHVPGRQLVHLRHVHRLLRHDHDQLHHERGGHCHIVAGGPGHRALPRRGPGSHPVRVPWSVAGMPFLLLVGAAPNAIAYDSGQFTTGEFFGWGVPASILLMVVVGVAVLVIWPIMACPSPCP